MNHVSADLSGVPSFRSIKLVKYSNGILQKTQNQVGNVIQHLPSAGSFRNKEGQNNSDNSPKCCDNSYWQR